MKKCWVIFIYLSISCLYPEKVNETPYKWPLGIFNGYSSSFQEFRGNHFHAGIDLRTFQKTGFPVYAIADGRITRIRRVKHGSGNGLYLNHDDGNTSIYFHLDKFTPEIEQIADKVRRARGKKYFGNYVLKKPPPVKAGEVIGFSGETGSGFPHLHLEIRDRNHRAINPFKLLKFPSRDSNFPVLKSLIFRNKTPDLINGNLGEHLYSFNRVNLSLYRLKERVVTSGKFDLILNARDISDTGKFVAPYEISFFIDQSKRYGLKFDRFGWEDNNQLGFVYDMDYSTPGNFFFNIFSQTGFEMERQKSGMDDVIEGLASGDHECRVMVRDNFGNVSNGVFTLCKVARPVVEISDIEIQPKKITMNLREISAPGADRILIRLLDENLVLRYSGVLNHTQVSPDKRLVLEGIGDTVRLMEFSFQKHGIEYDVKKILLKGASLPIGRNFQLLTFINRDLIYLKINGKMAAGEMALKVVQGGKFQFPEARDGNGFIFFCFRPSGLENDVELIFSDQKNRWLPLDESRKIRIIHLVNGQEQVFSDGEFEASFASGTVREPRVLLFETRNFQSQFPVESRQVSLAPRNFPFLDTVFYRFRKDVPDPQQVGIFRYHPGRKRWKYVSTIHEPAKLAFKTRLISSGIFALMRDIFPPLISLSKPGSKFRSRLNRITLRITDQGKGVDEGSLAVWVNRQKILDCEYDPDWRHVLIEDLRFLKAGDNQLKVQVKDHAGNQSTRTFRLFLE